MDWWNPKALPLNSVKVGEFRPDRSQEDWPRGPTLPPALLETSVKASSPTSECRSVHLSNGTIRTYHCVGGKVNC